MSFKFQLPPITSDMSIDRMRSYLMQLTDQMEYVLNNLETSNFTETSQKEITSNSAKIAQQTTDASAEVLKAFIVKNAETIYQNMQTLEQSLHGEYVALSSQFGQYRDETDLKISANAEAITQNYTDVQTMIGETNANLDDTNAALASQGNVVTVTSQWKEVTEAYIKSGKLYYENGSAVYGIAIGQLTYEIVGGEQLMKREGFYTVYTGTEMSFFIGSNRVAIYANDRVYIPNAEISGTLKIGRYLISDGANGLTFKYGG